MARDVTHLRNKTAMQRTTPLPKLGAATWARALDVVALLMICWFDE